jgi:hypothetical protein
LLANSSADEHLHHLESFDDSAEMVNDLTFFQHYTLKISGFSFSRLDVPGVLKSLTSSLDSRFQAPEWHFHRGKVRTTHSKAIYFFP